MRARESSAQTASPVRCKQPWSLNAKICAAKVVKGYNRFFEFLTRRKSSENVV